MDGSQDEKRALYSLYLATAEKVSDQRAQTNAFLLSINSSVLALYGFLQAGRMMAPGGGPTIWIWAIPLTGVIVCAAWTLILASYRKLSAVKTAVLIEMETDFPYHPFTAEQRLQEKNGGNTPLVDVLAPWGFIALYLAMSLAAFLMS